MQRMLVPTGIISLYNNTTRFLAVLTGGRLVGCISFTRPDPVADNDEANLQFNKRSFCGVFCVKLLNVKCEMNRKSYSSLTRRISLWVCWVNGFRFVCIVSGLKCWFQIHTMNFQWRGEPWNCFTGIGVRWKCYDWLKFIVIGTYVTLTL